jgi:hypothetical protein
MRPTIWSAAARARGLRIMLISQRPAKLHKDSLTQVETLIALRLIAPQDRAAVEDWIGEWADPKQGREVIASLPSLPRGTGWVWAPELGVLAKMAFPLIATFDSSSTPEHGEAAKSPVDLSAVDIAALRDALVGTESGASAVPKPAAPSRAQLEAAEKHGYPHPHRRGPQPGAEAWAPHGPTAEIDGGTESRSSAAASAGRYTCRISRAATVWERARFHA